MLNVSLPRSKTPRSPSTKPLPHQKLPLKLKRKFINNYFYKGVDVLTPFSPPLSTRLLSSRGSQPSIPTTQTHQTFTSETGSQTHHPEHPKIITLKPNETLSKFKRRLSNYVKSQLSSHRPRRRKHITLNRQLQQCYAHTSRNYSLRVHTKQTI